MSNCTLEPSYGKLPGGQYFKSLGDVSVVAVLYILPATRKIVF